MNDIKIGDKGFSPEGVCFLVKAKKVKVIDINPSNTSLFVEDEKKNKYWIYKQDFHPDNKEKSPLEQHIEWLEMVLSTSLDGGPISIRKAYIEALENAKGLINQ